MLQCSVSCFTAYRPSILLVIAAPKSYTRELKMDSTENSFHRERSDNITDMHSQRMPMVSGQRRKRPAWSDWGFTAKRKPAKPKVCDWCGEIKIALAHDGRKFFCTSEHGKLYLRAKKNPNNR